MSDVLVAVPRQLTPGMIWAVQNDPTTSFEDKEEWHRRLGWLICAWEVLIARRPERGIADARALLERLKYPLDEGQMRQWIEDAALVLEQTA